MGQCKLFRVENPHKYTMTKARGLSANNEPSFNNGKFASSRSIYRSKNLSLTRNNTNQSKYIKSLAEIDLNKQIIFFEGCNQVLGCTILLSGPINQNHNRGTLQNRPSSEYLKLLKVKANLRKMLHISRNIILEREFLGHLIIDPQVDIQSVE